MSGSKGFGWGSKGGGGALATGILQLQGGVPLDATLRNVADQAGTLSPLQLSTTQVGIAPSSYSNTSGTVGGFITTQTFAAGAGSADFRPLNIGYTINNSGAQSGTATGIFLNATETALNGMTHNLMDLQVGGVSKLSVSRLGSIAAYSIDAQGTTSIFHAIRLGASSIAITSPSYGVMTIYNGATSDFGRLQFGGTTNAFPSIKRNEAAIDFRLADDSGYAAINAGVAYVKGSGTSGTTNALLVQNGAGTNLFRTRDDGGSFFEGGGAVYATGFVGSVYGLFGGLAYSPSVVLGADSTVAGFLPPRMTTAQFDGIASKATGLEAYSNDDFGKLWYDGTRTVGFRYNGTRFQGYNGSTWVDLN